MLIQRVGFAEFAEGVEGGGGEGGGEVGSRGCDVSIEGYWSAKEKVWIQMLRVPNLEVPLR